MPLKTTHATSNLYHQKYSQPLSDTHNNKAPAHFHQRPSHQADRPADCMGIETTRAAPLALLFFFDLPLCIPRTYRLKHLKRSEHLNSYYIIMIFHYS